MSDNSTLKKLQVIIEGTIAPYKRAINEARSETRRMTDSVNREMRNIKRPKLDVDGDQALGKTKNVITGIKKYIKDIQIASGVKVYTDDYLKLENDIQKANRSAKLLRLEEESLKKSGASEGLSEQYRKTKKSAEEAEKALNKLLLTKKKLEENGEATEFTPKYAGLYENISNERKNLKNLIAEKSKRQAANIPLMDVRQDGTLFNYDEEIKKTEEKIKKLGQSMEELESKGKMEQPTDAAKKLTEKIDAANDKLGKYKTEMTSLSAKGLDRGTAEWIKNQRELEKSIQKTETLRNMREQLVAEGGDVCVAVNDDGAINKLKQIKSVVQEVISNIPGIGRAANTSCKIASKAFNGMKAVLSGVTTAIKRTSGVFGSLIKKFASGIPIVRRFTSGVHQNGNAFKGGLKNILKYAFGIRSLYMLVNKLRNALKEGFKNLAQYDDQTNASLSAIMSSLTQFKNSMATAFAPILNVVAPILVTLINYLTKAATALAHFFASLTGQSSVVVSKKVNQDYAASLNANASSADKADKANKKLKNTLMGFDQINKLDDNSDSDSNSGGLSPSDMFETTGIDSNVSDFVQKVKEAWNNADFTEIGEILGSKLNDALNGIPWTKIKATSGKVARSIATFLNGFLGETDWGLVGSTIADGINTGIEFAYTFVTTFDWKKFGKAFADGINGFVKKIDWKKSAQTLSEGLKGLLDTLIAAVKNIDWYQIGENIKIFLENIDWVGIVERIAELFGAACGGLAALLGGLLGDAFSATGKYFEDKAAECGGNMVLGILKGIVDGLVNISVWIVEHIFLPIINGFKDAFGIHSPSTVMAEQGGYIIEGLLQGLINNVKNIIRWFADLPGKIKDAMGDAKEWLIEKGKDIVGGLKNGFESCKEGIKDMASKIPELIKSGIGNLWDLGKNAISSFVSGFTSVNIPTPKISTVTGAVSSKIPKVSVKQYASGGQPGMGEMFIARESGPELVGKIGNKSTVANNGQIIEGIKAGVFEAVLDAFDAANTLFGGSNSDEKPVVVEFTFMCGDETIYKMSKRGKEKYEGRVSIVERV